MIRSVRRMTYTQVHAIIGGDPEARERFAPLVPEFERMYELARLLNKKRQRRGSIDFDLPEPVIEFDAQGAMQSIVRSERSWATVSSRNSCSRRMSALLRGCRTLTYRHCIESTKSPKPGGWWSLKALPPGLATLSAWDRCR